MPMILTQGRIINISYEYPGGELAKLIAEMESMPAEELRLWIIQELANFGHERWAVIEIGVQVLREKIRNDF